MYVTMNRADNQKVRALGFSFLIFESMLFFLCSCAKLIYTNMYIFFLLNNVK